jgi:hypothetical protein
MLRRQSRSTRMLLLLLSIYFTENKSIAQKVIVIELLDNESSTLPNAIKYGTLSTSTWVTGGVLWNLRNLEFNLVFTPPQLPARFIEDNWDKDRWNPDGTSAQLSCVTQCLLAQNLAIFRVQLPTSKPDVFKQAATASYHKT